MRARLSPRSMPQGTDVAICVFQLCPYMSILFPEPTCLLVSAKTRCLGADQKTRGLWERDGLHMYLSNFVSLQITQIYSHEGNRRALTFTVWSKKLYMVLTRSINKYYRNKYKIGLLFEIAANNTFKELSYFVFV